MARARFSYQSYLFAILATLIIASPIANAHEGEEEQTTAQLHGFAIDLTPSQVIQGDAVPIEAQITKNSTPATGLQVSFTVDKHEVGISDNLKTEEREPGKYFAKYQFTKSGSYEVHVEFVSDNEIIRETFDINVVASVPPLPTMFYVALAAIPLMLIWVLTFLSKKKNFKMAIVLSIVALILMGIGYSLYVTKTSGAAERGVIVCPEENNCVWTAHVHSYVPVEICGEDKRLPIEKGSLQGPHTHEEKNIIHWHDRLPYDKQNSKILDATPLTLEAFFDAINISFSPDKILDKNIEDACPDGTKGTLKMFVNGKESKQFTNYVWKDKDVILLVFDSRTPEEIEKGLAQNPITFPTLGRG